MTRRVRSSRRRGAPGSVSAPEAADTGPDPRHVRLVTYNTAAGNPGITTPQVAFLDLPFYREALAGDPGAAILALQEVGPAQAAALRAAARAGRCRVLQLRRPGLGNALVVPDRYAVLASRRAYFVAGQVPGALEGLRGARRRRPDWRQYGELRTWIEARLRDRASGRQLTVLTTHLSVEPTLKRRQARVVVRRAEAAARRGPVLLAGDFNVRPGTRAGIDAATAALLARLQDVGTPRLGKLDHVLARGFEPVRARTWSGTDIALPGHPTAETISDHLPEDVVVRYADG